MPGRAPRNGEQRLTGKQSREAGKFLRERWTPDTVWGAQEKAELTDAINMLFAGRGEPPVYSTRKLDDWLSNARYRANCKQRAKEPESWSLERRAQARQKTRKRNRGAQQKQRRGETAAKLRAVPIATAVPLVGWAAAPRVHVIRQQFETPIGVPPEVKQPADAGFGWADAAQRPQKRSQEFKAIRDKFERQRIGRTDEWASHRGYSLAPSSQAKGAPPMGDCAHFFEGDLKGERTAKAPDELVPTFLSVPGLPLPPAVDDDFMQSSPEAKPDVSHTMPEPLILGADTSQQELELGLDVSLDDLVPDLDLDMDIQSLPVVEGQLQEPMNELSDIQVDDVLDTMSFDSSDQSDATMKSWVSDYASQSAAPLPKTVDDNVDSGRVASETNMSGGGPPSPSVANMSMDTRGCTSQYPELSTFDKATAVNTVQPTLATAVASAVSAKAADVDILAAPGFLDTDLALLLPAFDEGEVPACLPTASCYDNYHGHTLQAAHAPSAHVM